MFHGGSINLNFGQGIAPGGCYGPGHGRGPCGPQGPQGQMMRMMQMMMQMMSQMMGGGPQQGGGCCCPNSRPSFGAGFGAGFQGPGLNINLGASIQGFLG